MDRESLFKWEDYLVSVKPAALATVMFVAAAVIAPVSDVSKLFMNLYAIFNAHKKAPRFARLIDSVM